VACGFGAAVLDKLSEMFQAFLRRGIENRKLSLLCQEFSQTIELALNDVYARVSEIAASEPLPLEERLAAQQTLNEFRARALAMRDELASLKRWLQNPPANVDLDSVTAETTAPNHMDCEDIDNILARLRTGGDI
jgi:hypothetical protein